MQTAGMGKTGQKHVQERFTKPCRYPASPLPSPVTYQPTGVRARGLGQRQEIARVLISTQTQCRTQGRSFSLSHL